MRWIPDAALDRLRAEGSLPDLSGTRYRIVEPIGRGGMGVVYLTEDPALERQVALKVLDAPDRAGELTARLIREARVLARLEHPGIVPVHDVGELPDGRPYYTMKLVRGQRLDRWAAAAPRGLAERLRTFIRASEAVAFAHAQGVLHRDLKPANIMVGPFGEVLVLDWGVAKVLRAAAIESEAPTLLEPDPDTGAAPDHAELPPTAHGAVLGTPGYMAPEQARGAVRELDQRADVYSLGAVLAELLSGEAPSPSAAVAGGGRARLAGVPKRLAAIVRKATAPEAGERYTTARELAEDVERFLDGRPVVALPEGLLVRSGRFLARHRVAVILLLVYALARALVIVFLGR